MWATYQAEAEEGGGGGSRNDALPTPSCCYSHMPPSGANRIVLVTRHYSLLPPRCHFVLLCLPLRWYVDDIQPRWTEYHHYHCHEEEDYYGPDLLDSQLDEEFHHC